MKKLYDEYLNESIYDTIPDKVFKTKITVSILTILLCMVAMVSTAIAYFSYDVSSRNNNIEAAMWNIDVAEVVGSEEFFITNTIAGKDLSLSQNDEHKFIISKEDKATATEGFCIIYVTDPMVNSEINTTTYVTEKFSDSIGITLIAGSGTTVKFVPHWGSPSGYYESTVSSDDVALASAEAVTVYSDGAVITHSVSPSYAYTVEEGATLSAIAKFYNVPISYICIYNGINEADVLAAGSTLYIPFTEVTEDYKVPEPAPEKEENKDETSGDETTGDNTTGNETAGNETAGDNTTGNETTGDKTTGNDTAGDNTTGDETTGDETTGDETTGDETTGDETTGDETAGDETTGDNTAGNETTGDNTSGDETTGDNTSGDETTGDNTTGDETTGNETTGDNTTGDETTGNETAGDNTAGNNNAGSKTDSSESSASSDTSSSSASTDTPSSSASSDSSSSSTSSDTPSSSASSDSSSSSTSSDTPSSSTSSDTSSSSASSDSSSSSASTDSSSSSTSSDSSDSAASSSASDEA